MKKLLLMILPVSFMFSSCSTDDDTADFREENRIAIEAYLAENGLTAESTPSGLYYIVEEEGNGNFPAATSTVTVLYRGYNLNGEVFDQTTATPASFPLTGVIDGWQEGMQKFSAGGSGKLFIPSHLAYSGNPPSNNQPIAFDIDLLQVD